MMNKYKAIPKGYMTVGEIAKKMGVTVRTLQYYDQEGLLLPSAESEGGRRLYTDQDMIKLYQILSLKSLGFSLAEIGKQLISLDNPADVAAALAGQAKEIKSNIKILSEKLKEIELLREEVLQMQSVDFKKYSDILTNLQMKNEYYWMVKHLDNQTLDRLRTHFDKESATTFINLFHCLNSRIAVLCKDNAPPESEPAQALAKEFWNMIIDFTEGDMSMLPKLMEMNNLVDTEHEEMQKQAFANDYIGKALDIYFTRLGVNPF